MNATAALHVTTLPDPVSLFCERAEVRAYLVAHGEMDLIEAVDGLQAAAVATGVIDALGQAAVQDIMAAAFGLDEGDANVAA